MFSGQDLADAFDKGAEATFNDMVAQVDELMAHNDVYEAYQFLLYYGEAKGYNVDILLEKLKY